MVNERGYLRRAVEFTVDNRGEIAKTAGVALGSMAVSVLATQASMLAAEGGFSRARTESPEEELHG